MPDILNPDVGAGREEEPVDRYEEEADHVAGEGNADEENWKSLKINIHYKYICGVLVRSHQSLVFEAVVDRSNEQPEGPKVFKPGK